MMPAPPYSLAADTPSPKSTLARVRYSVRKISKTTRGTYITAFQFVIVYKGVREARGGCSWVVNGLHERLGNLERLNTD